MQEEAKETKSFPAKVMLFGFRPMPARLEMIARPRWVRLTRAAIALGVALIVAPFVMMVPPHIEWVVVTLAAGGYFARRHWRSEYVVESFEGRCPNCGGELAMKPGTMLRFPHSLVCYQCHHEPWVEAA